MKNIHITLFLLVVILVGCSSEEELAPPTANFNYNLVDKFAPAKVDFINTSENASSYTWDFGDGSSTSNNENPSCYFESAGTYTVTLIVKGDGGTDKITKTINIKQKEYKLPTANFSYEIDNRFAPALVYFTNESKDGDSYTWNFGDGSGYNSAVNPNYTYQKGGIYTVSLKVKGKGGNDYISKTIKIPNTPTKVKIKNIIVHSYPKTEKNGAGWDISDGPDIFYQISDKDGNEIYDSNKSYRKTDVTPNSSPFYISSNFILTDLTKTYGLDFYDYDYDDNDWMGGYYLDPYNWNTDLDVIKFNSDNGWKIDLEIEWINQ